MSNNESDNEKLAESSPEIAGAASPSPTEPTSLAYESGVDRAKREPQIHVIMRVFVLAVGFFGAGFGVVFLSGIIFLMLEGWGRDGGRARKSIAAAIYGLALIGIVFLTRRFVRAEPLRTETRWLVLGGLIGLGVGMLVEGICFSFN